MLPIPDSLPTLLGYSREGDEVVSKILAGSLEDKDSLSRLSKVCRLKLKFREPVTFPVRGRIQTGITEFTPGRLFVSGNGVLCHTATRNGRRGYPIPLDKIVSYEPCTASLRRLRFKNYEEFRGKFDTLFIRESEIQKLWADKSSQHGGQYTPEDFRRLGPRGEALMKRFLERYKGIDEGGPGYQERDGHWTLREYYNSDRHPGRDLTISHQTNLGWVSYSCEYYRCGNGRYGLIANRHTYLWLEDD